MCFLIGRKKITFKNALQEREKIMKCDCKKDGNCKYQNAFDKGLSGILELHFGEHNPGWDVFEKAVKKYCQHRENRLFPKEGEGFQKRVLKRFQK